MERKKNVTFKLSKRTVDRLNEVKKFLQRKKIDIQWDEVFNILVDKFWKSEGTVI